MTIRQAQFTLRGGLRDVRRLEALLPHNYRITHVLPIRHRGEVMHRATVVGEDIAGWTLDKYVLPRAASGLLFGIETTAQWSPLRRLVPQKEEEEHCCHCDCDDCKEEQS